MADHLAKLPPVEVAAFYARLADAVDRNKGDLKVSLAALLMRQWLQNRDPSWTFVFDAPDHLKTYGPVLDSLKFHRRVLLTQEKARLGDKSHKVYKWAGVLPRYQGWPGFVKWDGKTPLQMDYATLVEIPVMAQVTGNDVDRDLLYGMHGFHVRSFVTMAATPLPTKRLRITFQSYEAEVTDRYHFDYSEHLKVPNPDHGSKANGAVAPDDKYVEVYHSNAKRVEDAKLAAPYDVRTKRWSVEDASVRAPVEIDPSQSL
jgi:hypothetical protein